MIDTSLASDVDINTLDEENQTSLLKAILAHEHDLEEPEQCVPIDNLRSL